MRSKLIYLSFIAILFPVLLMAQHSTVSSLVDSFSERNNVKYTKAGKAVIWMVKASAPKGAMDGVRSMKILEFKGGTKSVEYIDFHTQAMALFAKNGANRVVNEKKDDVSMEVYIEIKENPTEYMMFMHSADDGEIFMLMEGDLPSSLDK
ncbi:MAG: DUF4252 domain-containing protein [Rikenellaceae bacterium]